MPYDKLVKGVAISATGTYPQGDLTREYLQKLVESYDTSIHRARVRVAHVSRYRDADIPEAPVFAYVERLALKDKNGRTYLLADFKATDEFFEYKDKYPEFSIEIYSPESEHNPLNQPHIPIEKRNKPYLAGVAMLGATIPAVKGLETASAYGETSYRFDSRSFSDNNKTVMAMSEKMKQLAAELGVKEDNEDALIAKVKELMVALETAKRAQLDKEKMYSETTSALETQNAALKESLEKLQKEFAEHVKKMSRSEFAKKLSHYSDTIKEKVMKHFDEYGEKAADALLNSISEMQLSTQLIDKVDQNANTPTTKDYSKKDYIDSISSIDLNKRQAAIEWAEKNPDKFRKLFNN